MNNELQIALVSGPAYDSLYESLPRFTETTGIKVNVAFSGDHPSLNHHLATLPQVTYDLVSTHSKYAPSQLGFLAPLDEIVDTEILIDFVPLLLTLATIDGKLYGLPRNIDVRLLHYRSDLIESPPETWDKLFEQARKLRSADLYGFAFPGRESGLFGTFYELAEMAGAEFFPADLVPDIENDAGRWALTFLRDLYRERIVPQELTSWHYEEVHDCFKSGHAAMVCDWPGYFSLYRDPQSSKVHDRLGLRPYPNGPSGKSLSYGGGHTFALTKTGVQKPEALQLLLFLTDAQQQLLEARNGCVPVRQSVMQQMQSEADDANRKRLAMLETVITEHILIPPKFARYPEVEEILWRTVQRAIIGELSIDAALRNMREQIGQIVQLGNEVQTRIAKTNGDGRKGIVLST